MDFQSVPCELEIFLSGNKHFISVVVIIVEGKARCSTHFYGLIELKDDQTAETQFFKLKERFQVPMLNSTFPLRYQCNMPTTILLLS